MSSKILLTLLSGLAFGIALFLAGCSSDDNARGRADSVTDEIIDQIVDNSFIANQSDSMEATLASASTDEAAVNTDVYPPVYGLILKDSMVYTIVEGGILKHDLTTGVNSLIPADETIGAMIDIGEKILVGGSRLCTLDGDILTEEDFQMAFDGTVTALYHHGWQLIVGTTDGLYQVDGDGLKKLAADICVTGITSDGVGLWIGTAGDGLYYCTGETFRKRYLQRDSTLFNNVTALQYSHNHLYLGTDRGFFVYDGGRWQQYTLADGLPSEMITAVNADDWVVRIGTIQGPVTFYENEFKPISRFEGIVVNQFIRNERRLVAATSGAGLVMKSGGLLTTLYDGGELDSQVALESEW